MDKRFLDKMLQERKITQERYENGIAKLELKEKAKNDYKTIKERQGKPSSISDLAERIQKLEEILGL